MSTPAPVPQPSPVNELGTILLPSVLRTVVPIIYAMLVHWGITEWLDPEDALLTNLITALVTTVFYIVLRIAERYWDKIGWLLGYAKQPLYVKGTVLDAAEVTNAKGTVTIIQTDEPPAPAPAP